MNKLYKKILIATDGSEHTEKAITHAIELAKLTGAQLHAVYVISLVSPHATLEIKSDSDPGSYETIDASIEGLKNILRHEGDEAIKYVEEQAKRDGVDVRKWIMEGRPTKDILKLAEEESVIL